MTFCQSIARRYKSWPHGSHRAAITITEFDCICGLSDTSHPLTWSSRGYPDGESFLETCRFCTPHQSISPTPHTTLHGVHTGTLHARTRLRTHGILTRPTDVPLSPNADLVHAVVRCGICRKRSRQESQHQPRHLPREPSLLASWPCMAACRSCSAPMGIHGYRRPLPALTPLASRTPESAIGPTSEGCAVISAKNAPPHHSAAPPMTRQREEREEREARGGPSACTQPRSLHALQAINHLGRCANCALLGGSSTDCRA